jgi:hypothetical protein
MHVVFGHVRQIEIDDVRHPVDIDAAGGNVGGDKHAGLSVAKTGERAFALRLGFVAVNAGRLDAGAGQVKHDAVGAMLGSGKDEHACDGDLAPRRRRQSIGDAAARRRRAGYRKANWVCEPIAAFMELSSVSLPVEALYPERTARFNEDHLACTVLYTAAQLERLERRQALRELETSVVNNVSDECRPSGRVIEPIFCDKKQNFCGIDGQLLRSRSVHVVTRSPLMIAQKLGPLRFWQRNPKLLAPCSNEVW